MKITVAEASQKKDYFFNAKTKIKAVLNIAEISLADKLLIKSHWRKVANLRKLNGNITLAGI